MKTTPSRRWLRFSLRTLLILVTLACCYLAWEIRVVQNRQRLLRKSRSLEADGPFYFTTSADYQFQTTGLPPSFKERPARVPWLQSMLGAEAVQSIHYVVGWEGYSEDKLNELKWAFPEARFEEGLPQVNTILETIIERTE